MDEFCECVGIRLMQLRDLVSRNPDRRDHVDVRACSREPKGRSLMWIIVAVALGFGGQPKLAIVPGPEFPTEAACVKATHVRGNFDSEHADQGRFSFSFCVPKGSVQI